jgi:hypothetical protein
MCDCDPIHYIAARELDTTLGDLRNKVATTTAELKACKDPPKKPAKPFEWVVAVLMAVAFFCVLERCCH